MKFYCFLMKRQSRTERDKFIDNIPFPVVYESLSLAESAFGRFSPLVEVELLPFDTINLETNNES